MSLDLSKTVQQLDTLALQLRGSQENRARRLRQALQRMAEASPGEVRAKTGAAQGRPFLSAGVVSGLAGRHDPLPPPGDFCVVSVDGSHIDVDRHLPVACALVNIGGCVLRYGGNPNAYLFSTPRLYSDDELYITGPGSETPIEGAILGLKRTVEEVRALASLLQDAGADVPTVAVVDGSLVLSGLGSHDYPPRVRDEVLQKGLLPALDAIKALTAARTLALAAYVSLPRSRAVANALRLYLCTTDAAQCSRQCSNRRSSCPPCDLVNDFPDRDLFEALLEPGQRSELFCSPSPVLRDYGSHQVYFYYLHTGGEIARVEVPQWVADDEGLVALSHSLVLDQCRRGMGYPVAISEAHEQAVIRGPERQQFKDLVERALTEQRLPVYTSAKSRSKRLPWL